MTNQLRLGTDDGGAVFEVDPDIMFDGCLIVGADGSGKTSFVRRLIDEHLRIDCPVLAFDTTGDLTTRLQRDLNLEVSRHLEKGGRGDSRLRLRNVDLDDVVELFQLPAVADSGRLVSALLGVMQYRSRPGTPEHALIETLVLDSWDRRRGISLEELAAAVAWPPLRRLGSFDLDWVISSDRRESLASSLLSLRDTAIVWAGRTAQPPPVDALLGNEENAVATVLSFGQQSLRVRRFIVEVLLAMIEHSNPNAMLLLDEAAAFLPPQDNTTTSSMLLEALAGGTDFSNVRVVLVATEPDDLHPNVADLCETWVAGRMPAPPGRRQVVEALDLANPPVDEEQLNSDLMHLQPGQHVLRSARLDSLKRFSANATNA